MNGLHSYLSNYPNGGPDSSVVTPLEWVQFGSVTQSCLTLCDPMDWSTPGLPVHPKACSNFCPLSRWYHPTISSSVVPFSWKTEFNKCIIGLPWKSSGQDSTLPKQVMQVWSLVRELRSHMPCGGAKPKPNQNKKHCIWYIYIYISMLLLLSYFSRVWLCVTQRRQPTRLPYPWDSPGKNTGVDCHFLLQCMKVKCEDEVTQSCLTPSDLMDCSLPGSSAHGIFQARVLEWGAIAFSDIY